MSPNQSALGKHTLKFINAPDFALNPTGHAPLAGILTFTTDVPSYAVIYISDGERNWRIPTPNTFAVEHRHVLLGMRADRPHTVQVSVRSQEGDWGEWPEDHQL